MGSFQTSCKTQFADPEIHMELVGFLRKIEPFFEFFTVQDEGEFWDEENLHEEKNQLMESIVHDASIKPSWKNFELIRAEEA